MKMWKYGIVIREISKKTDLEISDSLDIGVYGFEEDYENKVKDEDSKRYLLPILGM